MNYQEYIDLGFNRYDMNDSVEFKQTGYHGFSLERHLNERLSIYACYGELDQPRLCIKKGDSDSVHRIIITPEMVRDLLHEYI